jgi:hypothetical protein
VADALREFRVIVQLLEDTMKVRVPTEPEHQLVRRSLRLEAFDLPPERPQPALMAGELLLEPLQMLRRDAHPLLPPAIPPTLWESARQESRHHGADLDRGEPGAGGPSRPCYLLVFRRLAET